MMLRRTLARKAFTAHTAAGLRRVHDKPTTTTLTPPPSSLAARASQPAENPAFPLYNPAPAEEEDVLKGVKLDERGLPSMDWIHRENKAQIVDHAIADVAEYDEAELRDFYKQVVLSGAPKVAEQFHAIEAPTEGHMSHSERQLLLSGLAERLRPREVTEEGKVALLPAIPKGTAKHVALTASLIDIAPQDVAPSALPVPLGLVRRSEWQALLDSFMDKRDAQGAEVLLSTMQRHGTIPSTEQLDKVVELYSARGETTEVARLVSDFEIAGMDITNHHRDLLISSYLSGAKPDPKGAISILTASENMGRPFPQSSYNVVLSHLVEPTITTHTDSHSRALAWDLFAHMRFAAHPVPSRELYTTMIRACGESADPQPERARDLWIEFTTDSKLEPRREEYDAIIRALGSTKSDYLEAFDLLRQMLAKHQEATFVPFEEEDTTQRTSPWVPTVETFKALLEGTKRAGDLDRARWVLSEVVDLARAAAFTGRNLKGPDEELMTNMFMTYAAWNAPITRSSVKAEKADGAAAAPAPETEGPTEVIETESSGSDMPRTSAEALLEVDLLFERLVHDARAALSGPANVVHYPFCGVKLTSRLVNSYLAAHLKHSASYTDARAVSERVWAAFAELPGGPRPNGWTFLQVMDRCVRGRLSKDDRGTAFAWGREAWDEYVVWSKATLPSLLLDNSPAIQRKRWLLGLGERQLERMWSRAIRLAAMEGDIDRSLALLADFVKQYPAADLLRTYAPNLKNEGFMFSMQDPAKIAEPNVPPHLLFKDLDVVHQACIRDEHAAGIKQIKHATTSYLQALKKRKRMRVGGAGVEREVYKRKQRTQTYVRPGSLSEQITAGEDDE